MKLPIARTHDEAMLWLGRTPCPRCAATSTDWEHGLDQGDDGELMISYDTDCQCGEEREYFFALPAQEAAPPAFGGDEPSELIDAGQWLGLADQLGTRVPRAESAARAEVLALAAAAVDEVVKFIPPGHDAVPDSAFWTDEGRAVRAEQPGRFRRERLAVVGRTYRSMA